MSNPIEYHRESPLLITYDNAPTENTRRFIATLKANAWDHALIGEGETWAGWTTRMTAYRRHLDTLRPTQIVVLSDARDVLCVRGSKAFLEGFRSFKKDLVVSMELFCGGKLDVAEDYAHVQCTPLTHYWRKSGVSTLPSRKFVNNGLIAGTVQAVKRFLQWALENKYTDDQFALGNYMNTFPELVAADTAAELLHTTTFGVNAGIQDIHRQKQDAPTLAEVLGRGAFFLHVPGSSSKGQKVIYDLVCTLIDAGAGDAMLGGVYKYAEPEWNEVF